MTAKSPPDSGQEPRRRGDAVVRRVLDVTLQQLGLVGFERLSIPEIAALVGVNKTSIYRRWPTKAELVAAALGDSMDHIHDIPDAGSIQGDLKALAQAVVTFATSARGMGVLRMVFVDRDNPEVRAMAASMWQEAGGDLPRIVIERAMKRGELPADADMQLLLFTLAGAVLHRVFVERAEADEAFVERLVNLVLYGAVRR